MWKGEEPGVWLKGGGPFKAFHPWGGKSERVVMRAGADSTQASLCWSDRSCLLSRGRLPDTMKHYGQGVVLEPVPYTLYFGAPELGAEWIFSL